MPININPINLAALAAIAGKNAPDYNLKPATNDMSQSLLGMAQLEAQQKMQEEALANAILKAQYEQSQQNYREQLQSQTQLATNANTVNATMRGQDITMRGQDIESMDKAAWRNQQREIAEAKLGLDYKKFDFDQYKSLATIDQQERDLQEKTLMGNFTRQLQLSKDARENMGGIMRGFLYTAERSQDTGALQFAQNAAIDQMLDNKLITSSTANSMRKMSPEEFTKSAAINAQINDSAIKASQNGMTIKVNPQTGETEIYQGPTQATKTDAQGKIVTQEKQQAKLNMLENAVQAALSDPKTANIFTVKGDIDKTLSVQEERLKGLPLVGPATAAIAQQVVGYTPEERAEIIKTKDTVSTMTNQLFNAYRKEITGAAAAVQELEKLQKAYMNDEVSLSQFYSRMKTIRDMGLQELDVDQAALQKGVKIQSVPVSEIEQVMKVKKMTRAEVENKYNVRGI